MNGERFWWSQRQRTRQPSQDNRGAKSSCSALFVSKWCVSDSVNPLHTQLFLYNIVRSLYKHDCTRAVVWRWIAMLLLFWWAASILQMSSTPIRANYSKYLWNNFQFFYFVPHMRRRTLSFVKPPGLFVRGVSFLLILLTVILYPVFPPSKVPRVP